MYQTCYVGILFYIVILELCIGAKAANTNSMDDEKVKKGTMDIYHYDLCDHINDSRYYIVVIIYISFNIP